MNSWSDKTPAESLHPHLPGIWIGIGTVLLYFVLQFILMPVMSLLVTLAMEFSYGLKAGLHHLKVDPAAIERLVNQPDARVSAIVLMIIAAAALMLWFIHHWWRSLWAVARPPGLGVTQPASAWYFVWAVLIGLAAAFLGGMLAHALANGNAPKQDITLWARSVSLGFRIPLALATVCVAPLVEEAIFRGVLLSGLMRRMQVGWAVLLSALIFGCVHLPDFQFAWYPVPTLVLFGMLLAWLRLQSRSLWPSVTAHATNNLLAVISWFVVAHPHV